MKTSDCVVFSEEFRGTMSDEFDMEHKRSSHEIKCSHCPERFKSRDKKNIISNMTLRGIVSSPTMKSLPQGGKKCCKGS